MSRITRRFSHQPSQTRRPLHPWALVTTPKVDDDEDNSNSNNDHYPPTSEGNYDENVLRTPVLRSPSKSVTRSMTTPYSTLSSPPSHRSFGEEMEGHHHNNNRIIIDTTLVSTMEHAARQQERLAGQSYSHAKTATLTTGATTMSSTVDNEEVGTVASDTHSEVSSVAHLRGWLDGFGKQRKEHFERTTTKITPEEAQRPTRTKVKKTADRANKPTPLPPQAASALAKRLVDTGLPRNPYTRSTPIRIKTKQNQQDVRATDEGYKSVAQLSAWLAEDPTKAKTSVKVLRRGANVIAKSRAFDKNLVDVLIEQDIGRSTKGLVAAKKQMLAPSLSGCDSESGSDSQSSHHLAVQQWPETASTISVSHKKQWLKQAFRQHEGTAPPKAHTEVVTAQDGRAAVSNRAKHMWRQRLPKKKENTPTKAMDRQESEVAASRSVTMPSPHRISSRAMRTPVVQTMPIITTPADAESSNKGVVHESVGEEQPAPETAMEPPPQRKPLSGFSAARDQLVQRAHQNGNPVNVTTRVKNRAAKFERLEKESRRKSQPHGNLKSTWVEGEGRPSNSYIRSFVSDVIPPKAFEELP